MRKIVALARTVAATLVLAGCSSLAGGELIRAGEPTGVIQLVNDTGMYIDAVTVSDCDNFTHGLNRLPDGYAIPPGGRYEFTVSAGCWDVMAGVVGYGESSGRMQVPANGVFQYVVQS